MPLEDGAGLRQGTAGTVLLQMLYGPNEPVDLSGSRTVTVDCKLNGLALGGSAVTTTTKVSIDGVEPLGKTGWVSVAFSSLNLNANGTLTIEPTVTGSPTVNSSEKPIRIPVRPVHADAGDTGVFVVDVRNQAYNVRNYGAVGDGTTDDTAAGQAALDACSAAGGGVVYFPEGTFKGNWTFKSNVTIQGAGRNVTTLKAFTAASPVLSNAQVSGVVSRCLLRDFRIQGDNATASQVGLLLAGFTLSKVENLRLDTFTQTGGTPIKLTSWNDGGTYRSSIENEFESIETSGDKGILITKHASDPSTNGCNNNKWIAMRCSNVVSTGIDVDAGEGNSFYGCVVSSSNAGIICYRVNDDVTGLYSCNADCSATPPNGSTGVKVESGVNDCFIVQRTGNGPQTAINDSGVNTMVFRHPDTRLGGTVIIGSASTGLGFYGTASVAKQTVTGSRGANAALQSLLTKLATLGLITDSSS